MAYIGRGLDKISNVEVLDNLTFDGSSTSFTLQKGGSNFTPSSANNILVSIDGVVQAGNFTCSGSTIDFGVAVSASSTCNFIIHYGVGVTTTPSDGSVTTAKIASSAVDLTSKVTGTLPITNGGIGATTLAGAGLANTPSFCAVNTSTQSVTATTNTKINFGTERWDTNSAYDTSTSRFTVPSGQAGKYHFGCQLYTNYGQSGTYGRLRFYKNGSEFNQQIYGDGVGIAYGISVRTNVELAVGDYMEVYFYHTRTAGPENVISSTDYTQFFGYKLIGV